MARGLMREGEQRERIHVETRVRRSNDSGAAELERDVRVEELRGEDAEEVDTVRGQVERVDMRINRGQVEAVATSTLDGGTGRGTDLTIDVPALHITGVRSVRAVGIGAERLEGRVVGAVDLGLEAEREQLNGPLQLLQQDAVGVLVQVLGGLAMDADEHERNAVNEDIMDLRDDEQVVDVQVERRDLGNGERRREDGGRLRGGVDDGAEDVGGVRDGERHEALAIRNRDGREGEADILVEPEQQRNPQNKVLLRLLVGLVAVIHVRDDTLANRGTGLGGPLRGGLAGQFLAHASLPSNELVLRDMELTVKHVRFTRVGINGVRVDFEGNLVEEALTRVVAHTHNRGISSNRRAGVSPRRDRGTHNHVDHHIREEIAVLGHGDRNIRAERHVVGSDLEVLEGNRHIWLVVGVHEQNVRALQIGERGVHVGFTGRGTTGLGRGDVVAKDVVGKQQSIHPAVITDELENTPGRHG